jgi:hypothetical protein
MPQTILVTKLVSDKAHSGTTENLWGCHETFQFSKGIFISVRNCTKVLVGGSSQFDKGFSTFLSSVSYSCKAEVSLILISSVVTENYYAGLEYFLFYSLLNN